MLKYSRLFNCHKQITQTLRYRQSQTLPYVQELFQHWTKDKESVGKQWNSYFSQQNQTPQVQPSQQIGQDLAYDSKEVEGKIELMYKCYHMFRTFFFSGHQFAQLDPLNLEDSSEYGRKKKYRVNFDLDSFKINQQDLDKPIYFGDVQMRSFIYPFMVEKEEWTAREIHQRLTQLYGGGFGVESSHIESEAEKHWLEEQIMELSRGAYSKENQMKTLQRLANAHIFNESLKTKFPTSKRFGIEGNDTLISGLGALVDQCSEEQIENVVFGMAHRGRLSTLANVFQKPLEMIFSEFQNKYEGEDPNWGNWGNSGDVKYHLGAYARIEFPNKQTVKLIMLPNPSHLEAVNPVVTGKTRHLQELNESDPMKSGLSLIIHGDASIAGQGVVYEQFQMQNLEGYGVKGTIHIVVNNQIGFTATPAEQRSGLYCTEVAKAIDAPIIHVNGDYPDLVDSVMRVAVQYRVKFQKDIVIDLIGYRRYGHNEQDQPLFTQPVMYKKIDFIKPVYLTYIEQLLAKNVVTQQEIDKETNEITAKLDKAYHSSRKEVFNASSWTSKPDDRPIEITKYGKIKDTGVPIEVIKKFGSQLTNLPQDLEVHPTLKKIYDLRRQSIQDGKNIDFATAESLAFGTLLDEGFSVRLSGQDVERGTFSHRHCVLNDQTKDIKYYPLRQLLPQDQQRRFQVYNSHLSEYGVLGFEYGYSLANPNTLTLWEAQFGDFANGAQIMIDNFICSGESKWQVPSGLVMLLPHGMDGQGPEHSSARLERFLQLMDDDPELVQQHHLRPIKNQILNANMQICACSNAANYFHVLRRQIRREFRKPLILINSKKLLKFARASSELESFKEGSRFIKLIPEQSKTLRPPKEIKKVIICYGQVYYDISDRRDKLGRDDVAILRIEQIAPFPYDPFKNEAKNYTNAEFVFCQEEHQNQGGWGYLEPRIHSILQALKEEGLIKNSAINYCGRRPSSSTAAGSAKVHSIELEKVLHKLYH